MIDLKYELKYDYDREYSCSETGCDDICRCMEIVNPRIVNIDLNNIVESIYNEIIPTNPVIINRNKKIDQVLQAFNMEILDKYCIHRILTILGMWSPERYEFDIINGYYGQEVDSVFMVDENKILDTCRKSFNFISPVDKINFILGMEYGKVIYDIKDVKLVKINRNSLTLNDNYFGKINKEIYYGDNNYLLPRGLVRRVRIDTYSIIDGYHRIKSSDHDEVMVWEIL